jgi:hypothetical protein
MKSAVDKLIDGDDPSRRLRLKKGDTVIAVIKATEVMVSKENWPVHGELLICG